MNPHDLHASNWMFLWVQSGMNVFCQVYEICEMIEMQSYWIYL